MSMIQDMDTDHFYLTGGVSKFELENYDFLGEAGPGYAFALISLSETEKAKQINEPN